MGYDTGDFIDTIKGPLHVEASSRLVIVHYPNEMDQALRMVPEEAAKLCRALNLALWYYNENPFEYGSKDI